MRYAHGVRFVHAADVHLDSPLSGLDHYEGAPADQFRGATRGALKRLVALCLEEKVDLLLVAGDLYDGTWHDYNTGLFFAKQMALLKEANVRVVVVSGNHDALSRITGTLRWPDNVRVLSTDAPETHELPDLGVAVHGQGFKQRRVTEDLTRHYPKPVAGAFNIGLLHTSLDGREGHAPYAPTSLAALRERGYAYWALGHVHAREVVSETPWVVFPGNLQGRHAKECGPKGATLVEVEAGRVASAVHRPLDVVRWSSCDVSATGARSRDEVLDRVHAALDRVAQEAEPRPVAARVRITGATEAHVALRGDMPRLEADVRALGHGIDGLWVEKVHCETAPASSNAEIGEAAAILGEELGRLRADDSELARVVKELRERLPRDAQAAAADDAADDAADARANEARRVLDDVEAMLGARLLPPEPT